jgi:hypothetical protein
MHSISLQSLHYLTHIRLHSFSRLLSLLLHPHSLAFLPSSILVFPVFSQRSTHHSTHPSLPISNPFSPSYKRPLHIHHPPPPPLHPPFPRSSLPSRHLPRVLCSHQEPQPERADRERAGRSLPGAVGGESDGKRWRERGVCWDRCVKVVNSRRAGRKTDG